MPPESSPAPPRAHPSQFWRTWFRRARPLRPLWPYALVAAALLSVSEMLWLWHSWPVRQVLESERLTTGASI